MALALYNDNDPYVAQWLRNLISRGLIPPGDVDERSIVDIRPEELARYVQCHFFAGVAGWPEALRLAGWPVDRPVWTVSCPCQPLSVAGPRTGHLDERHLWPAFYRLVPQCGPSVVFGEQTSSKDGLEWLAGVRLDMEAAGYAFGAANLPSASVGAPHGRHRLHWVAYADGGNASPKGLQRGGEYRQFAENRVSTQGLEHSNGSGFRGEGSSALREAPPEMQGDDGERERLWSDAQSTGSVGPEGLGHTESEGFQGQWREYRPRGERHSGLSGFAMQTGVPQWNGPTIAIACSDGPRRVSAEPDTFPLAHGVQGRMGRLRAYGNAINPHLAAEFIRAAEEANGQSSHSPTVK